MGLGVESEFRTAGIDRGGPRLEGLASRWDRGAHTLGMPGMPLAVRIPPGLLQIPSINSSARPAVSSVCHWTLSRVVGTVHGYL